MSARSDKTKPRLGIVLTKIGIPSEIWALRQAEAFTSFEPVYFASSEHAEGWTVPEGRELYLLGSKDPAPEILLRKVQRRFGFSAGAYPVPKRLKEMRDMLQAARLDAVLCHFAWNGVSVAAANTGIPLICHVHGRDVSANLRWSANRAALAKRLPDFRLIIAVGRFQVDILKTLWNEADATVIPCGAPTSLFAAMPLPERQPDDPVVFITVGRLSEEKGQMQTLTAFEHVRQSGIDCRLIIVGDGPLWAQLQAQIASSPARDAVEMTGSLHPADVATRLAKAHVYLQHSRPHDGWIEGFGVTLAEAGAAGLPLIASDLGGIPDQVIPNQNGYLHAADDVAQQAAYMMVLAKDEAQRQLMGAKAREIAQRFDSTVMAKQLEDEIIRAL